MAHGDPFTLDFFGSTILSSGLAVGVTALPVSVTDGPDDDPPPNAPAPAMPTSAAGARRN